MITWDEPKRQRNIRTHALDFIDCESMFDRPLLNETQHYFNAFVQP